MKNIILDRIKKGGFNLPKVLERIDQMYIEEKITLDEKQELENEARVNAEPEASYASAQAQINALGSVVKELQKTVKNLADELSEIKKNQTVVQPETPEDTEIEVPEEIPTEPEVPEEPEVVVYPEYVQPLGAHDAYQTGDKISYNGKNYECIIDNCVWNPTTYPAAWQEIVAENSAENTENSAENTEENL